MPIVTIKNLYHSFGSHPILDHIDLGIDKGERICLVGRNGTGKSTLLKLLSKQNKPDEGEINYSQGIRVGELRQDVPVSIDGRVYDVVAEGVGELGKVITEWHHCILAIAEDPSALKQMEILQQKIEAQNGWNIEQRISSTISLLKLPSDEKFDALTNPYFFFGQFLVKQCVGCFFSIQLLLFGRQVFIITARPTGQLPPVQIDNACGQIL